MKIYSEAIKSFTLRCENYLKMIMSEETELELRRTRFEYNKYTYPLSVIIFIDSQKLGYFDPTTYQIGLHASLMYQAKEHVIKNILRHELAHYLCWLKYGLDGPPHGENFKDICKKYHWDQKVDKASIDIKLANEFEGDLASEKIISKVKALFKLAESDNEHEARLATIKANQLLIKHNLEKINLHHHDILYSQEVYSSKRKNAKTNAFYSILMHFFVKPVIVHSTNKTSLEVFGTKENIELAQYITHFLERNFEQLWKDQDLLKGLKAKNSFFLGIAKGYEEKMLNVKKDFSQSAQTSLLVLSNQLATQVEKFCMRLSYSRSQNQFDKNAFQSGKEKGHKLNINPALKNKTKTHLLFWK
ncbi:MAG: DUF2786 domain-containing protein [Halobacteriovoraceae bacterium]|jgi:hypothetical protein|nr:DUF2786 domain-containing protein [Halobacteriovoraceae bacterium]